MKKRTLKERKEYFKKAYYEGLKAIGIMDDVKPYEEEPEKEVKPKKTRKKKVEE
jgi:hypothetical protein